MNVRPLSLEAFANGYFEETCTFILPLRNTLVFVCDFEKNKHVSCITKEVSSKAKPDFTVYMYEIYCIISLTVAYCRFLDI